MSLPKQSLNEIKQSKYKKKKKKHNTTLINFLCQKINILSVNSGN